VTSRERILTVLRGEIPDHVPVCPDISNMVPCRLTGKPFWDIYVYRNPPLWKAHIDALKHFGIDGGFEIYGFPGLFADGRESPWERRIVHRWEDGSFATREWNTESETWHPRVTKHTADNPPAGNLPLETIGLPEVPDMSEPIEGVKDWPTGIELWKLMRRELGEDGVLGMPSGASTCLLYDPDDILAYADDPEPFRRRRDWMIGQVTRRMEDIAGLEEKPDLLFCGASGSLVWQSPAIFRELALPVLKHVTELAYDLGIPTHVHSCGPEKELVRMAAEETSLTVVDPLEIPPMGDCVLSDLKERYGAKLVLKGNLHTTTTMLFGSAEDVAAASRKAIDDAAKGGRFILSTGDQCGRDTPDENIEAMVETARTYGKY